MAKIGRFKNDRARAAHLAVYDEMAARSPIPFDEQRVETSFGTTHISRFGSGDATPLVLLHPVGGNGAGWAPVIEGLSADRVVYAPDTIGTPGKSVQTAPITAAADFGTWLDETLAGLGVDRAHLLGYSDGGWQAAVAGLHNAKRLASVTLVETGGVLKIRWSVLLRIMRFAVAPTERNMRRLNRWLMPGVEVSELDVRAARASVGYRRQLPWGTVLTDAELGSFTIPSLWVFGSESVLVRPAAAAARRVRDRVPAAEVEVFDGLGHGLFFANADIVVPRIVDFLRRHDGQCAEFDRHRVFSPHIRGRSGKNDPYTSRW